MIPKRSLRWLAVASGGLLGYAFPPVHQPWLI